MIGGMSLPPPRQRPWVQLPDQDEDALRESIERLIDVAVALPHAQTRQKALNIALWQFTEMGGGARKTQTRYRSHQAVQNLDAKVIHEHVVERRWLIWALRARPDMCGEILGLAIPCLVTKAEHDRLTTVGSSLFGWQRYHAAGIVVLDAKHDFKPVDMDTLLPLQLAQRDHVQANIRELRRKGLPADPPVR
jgi:hypothetical protein